MANGESPKNEDLDVTSLESRRWNFFMIFVANLKGLNFLGLQLILEGFH